MLEEAIYKFKVSGPTIMPSLFDNFFLKETEAYNGYAILTYEVHQPLPIDEVLNIMDSDAYMRILYYTHPNPKAQPEGHQDKIRSASMYLLHAGRAA